MNENLSSTIGNLLSSLILQRARYTVCQKDMAELLQNGCSLQTFTSGQKIINCGFEADKIYVLMSGSCLIICYSPDGNVSVQDSLSAPQILGLTELVGEKQSYSASVVGDTTGIFLAIPSELFRQALQRDLATNQAVIKYLTYLAIRNMDAWEYYNLYTPQDTLAIHLYNWSMGQPLPYRLKMGRRDLAEFLHIQVRSLYRYLDTLKQQNLCCIVNGKITITETNFQALKEHCSNIS